jgi:hypothetical protein
MTEAAMVSVDKVIEGLKFTRDEIALKIHLGSRDLQDEWNDLEKPWRAFEAKADLDRSAKDVSAAVQILAAELKGAYDRLSKAL